MNRLDGLIRVNDSQSHSHFAVVEIHYQGRSSIMHFLFWTKPMSILHILIINFNCLLPLIQTQYSSKILRVVYPFYPVIMQQKVLLLPFFKLNVKLCVLLILLHHYHLSHHVLEDLFESNRVLTLNRNLFEHVLQTHHIEGSLLERRRQRADHHYNEVLYSALLVWQHSHLLLNFLQLLVIDESADVCRRILLKRLFWMSPKELLAIVKGDLEGLLGVDKSFECLLVLLIFLIFFQS